jgi:hypothetical protein
MDPGGPSQGRPFVKPRVQLPAGSICVAYFQHSLHFAKGVAEKRSEKWHPNFCRLFAARSPLYNTIPLIPPTTTTAITPHALQLNLK